ncbi:MAG: PilZ domain-containing protein [Desulfuromonadaceae bacterium]|nr:PilZ domain-containing protein [Desulfuromonadaceae bacterium]
MAQFALFKFLEKPSLLRVYILLKDDSKARLEAVARIIAEPYLELKFRPNELPMEQVRKGGKLLLSMDTRVGTVSMYAHVDEVTSSRVLRVMAIESFSYAQQREYFRVNSTIKVAYKPLRAGSTTTPEAVATASINLSGGGVLVSCEERLRVFELFELCFYLPEQEPFWCTGQVVRLDNKLRGGYEAAFRYTNIENEDQDRLISFCLAEQRRLLRTKVQVAGF